MKLFFTAILQALDINSTTSTGAKSIEKYIHLLFILAIVLICYLPFLNKAYNIDDPLFLWSAQHIQNDPLDPYGFNINWYRQEMPMSFVTKNPPLASYYIAAAAFVLGWGEAAIHFTFLFPAIAVAFGTYFFAGRFCRHPLLATLAGILTPVFLVSSLTVMSDTLMLAFWIGAVLFWMHGADHNNSAAFIASGLLMTCAAATKYFGMMLIPLLLIYSLYRDRRIKYYLLYFLIPLVLLALYQWRTASLYGHGLLGEAAVYSINTSVYVSLGVVSKMFINFAFIGACLASVLLFSTSLWPRTAVLGASVLCIVGVVYFSRVEMMDYFFLPAGSTERMIFSVQFCVWAIVGISLVILSLQDLFHHRNADTILLFLWTIGTMIFAGFINWSINGRSILPMIIPAGILITRKLENGITNKIPRKSSSVIIALSFSAILSVTITSADVNFANTARFAAKTICYIYGGQNHTLWFQGHWGYQYYMEQLGARPIDVSHQQMKPGDLIADPTTNSNLRRIPSSWVTRIDSMSILPSRYVASVDAHLGAGFYSNMFGPLPFAFGFVKPEKFTIYLFRGYDD